MAEGEIDMLGVETYFCNDTMNVRANSGGYSEFLVKLNTDVFEGDMVAVQYDAFGDVRESYLAPVTGKVLSVGTDPIREPGALLTGICFTTPMMSKAGPGTPAPTIVESSLSSTYSGGSSSSEVSSAAFHFGSALELVMWTAIVSTFWLLS
jgi:hypothetical protein